MKASVSATIIVMFFISCIKETEYHPKPPAATTSGLNTMGFLYNGSNIWVSVFEKGDMFGSNHYDEVAGCTLQHYLDSSLTFTINGSMYLKNKSGTRSTLAENSDVTIILNKASFANKTYSFDSLNFSKATFTNALTNKKYYNLNNTFILTVTYIDSTQKIISGFFSGTLYRYSDLNNIYQLDDSLQIHDGRFDIGYFKLP
ncbi:MAG: hypothetical protein M3R50_08130 [Bacteroidota bacterium]|nr:hypothetical protein [Bacteroidota bacterium]